MYRVLGEKVPFVSVWSEVYITYRSSPLVTILRPKTGDPPLAAARMQRWSLILPAC